MVHSTTAEFEKAILEHGMLDGEKGVLVGYSGGADSAALLHLMKRYCEERGLYLTALHVHHGIRGEEADRDAALCEKNCKELGIPFILRRADIPALAKEQGRGIEEVARDFRYGAFSDAISGDDRLTCVATAHNADDNAETVLFNLARGSGASGMCGIPPIRMLGGAKVIRPLLFTAKSEIVDYCEQNGIEYIFDSTNSDTAYTRNYIRHEIMPLFSKLNPSFIQSVGRMTRILDSDRAYLDGEADEFLSNNLKNGGVDVSKLVSLPHALSYRIVRRLFASVSDAMLERVHFDAVMSIVKGGREGACANIADGVRAVICEGRLFFTKDLPMTKREFEYELFEGANVFENEGFAVFVEKCGQTSADLQKDNETLKNIYKLSIHALVNSDKINRVLKVRSRRDGDSYVFGGMTRKLKKLYNDRGFTARERELLPICCDDSGILWVPGFKVADRAAAEDGKNAVKITYYYNGDNKYDK